MENMLNTYCVSPAGKKRRSHPHPPLLPPLLLLELVVELPTTQGKTRTRISQVRFAPVNYTSTTVPRTRPIRCRHCRERLRLFHKMPVYLLPVCLVTQRCLPLLRAHGLLRRVGNSDGTVPATGTRVSSAVPLSQGTILTAGTRASCAVLLGHGQRREPALPAPFPLATASVRRRGYVFQAPPPSKMAREPALQAPLGPATRRAAMRLLLRRVALLSERVHLLSLTMWWRSV